jgi:hypothetical protein
MVPSARFGRGWVWFFVALAVLTVAAIGVQIWYNAGQQLTWEQLTAANQLWKEHGPADYDLTCLVRKLDSTDTYHVEVRHKQVALATLNGQTLEPRLAAYWDMPHLFSDIEGHWQQDHPRDRQPERRTFVTAVFDARDGHVLHYVRSVLSTRERVEITVELR